MLTIMFLCSQVYALIHRDVHIYEIISDRASVTALVINTLLM